MSNLAHPQPPVNDSAYEVIADADADETTWLEARRSLITASNLPQVLGIKRGAPKLWYRMAGMLARNNSEPEYATFGKKSEDFNATHLYTGATGRKVKRVQQLLRSRRYPWLGATLDYVVTRFPKPGHPVQYGPEDIRPWERVRWKLPAPLELKSTGLKKLWPDDGEAALQFQAQLQGQMVVLGAEWGSLSAIIGQPYLHHRWADFPRHEDFCNFLVERSHEFYESLKRGEPPVDDDPETGRSLRHLKDSVLRPGKVVLPPAAEDWARRLDEAKQRRAEAERDETYYSNLICTAIGVADESVFADGTPAYTFRQESRTDYSVDPCTFRVLRRIE